MITLYPYNQLGHVHHGWLNAHHHFSFGNYYNPHRMHFGKLRVINDDIIQSQSGFGMHPHNNMEIITYIRSGAITHQDNQGNQGRTQVGDVQVMSAGSGIFHSEHNLENEPTTLYQIWIDTNKQNVKPIWATHKFPQQYATNQLSLLVSGDGRAPLHIYQDASIYVGNLQAHTQIHHTIRHQAYILVSKGKLIVESVLAQQGDGLEITDQTHILLRAENDCEVLVIDVPA